MTESKCWLWNTMSLSQTDGDYYVVNSPRAGGLYKISKTLVSIFKGNGLHPKKALALTEYLQKQRLLVEIPQLTTEALEYPELVSISISDKRDRLLLWIYKKAPQIGSSVVLPKATSEKIIRNGMDNSNWSGADGLHKLYESTAACAFTSVDETLALIDYTQQQGLIEAHEGGYRLTFAGLQHVERITKTTNAAQAFVAMWFSGEMNEVYESGFAKAIEDVGYLPLRIDRKEHNNKIDDEIISEIRRSKFLVADFTSEIVKREAPNGKSFNDTHARGGVYFEAGFAKGLGKEVIWTVREDVLPFVHFDTRQFAHIVWKDAADLSAQLSRRISATLGDGPNKKTV